MTGEGWLTIAEFAAVAGIGEGRARRAARRALQGSTWRGCRLVVRKIHGRGGANGQQYQVWAASLPSSLATEAVPSKADVRREAAAPVFTDDERGWKLEIVYRVMAHPPRSAARAAAIEAEAAKVHRRTKGRVGRVSPRTIRDWIARYELDGTAGIPVGDRGDKGKRRNCISRLWDRAVPFDDQTKAAIACKLNDYLENAWRSGASGAREVCRLGRVELIELTKAQDFDCDDLAAICAVPKALAMAKRDAKVADIRKRNAKEFDDNYRRPTRRSRAGMLPMEIVVADVHPVDVLVERADGSTGTPRLIAFECAATNRLHCTLVMPDKGKGIRQEHVIGAFIAMTQDPCWGLPSMLQIDNGGEYNWAKFIDDAMRLTLPDGCDPRRSMIIKSRAYNARAKTIEGKFSAVEKLLAALPGSIGGNRMAKKTHNVGKAPEAFGTFDDFLPAFQTTWEYYETQEQTGHLEGSSPRARFNEFVAEGWGRIDIDPDALHVVFAREVERTLRQRTVQFDNDHYYLPAFGSMIEGTRLTLRIPHVGSKEKLAVLGPDRNPLGMAEKMPKFGYASRDAFALQREHHSNQKRYLNALEARLGDPLDITQERAKAVALEPPAYVPASAGKISLGDTVGRLAEMHRAAKNGEPAALTDAQAKAQQTIDLWSNFGSYRAAG